jgi:hypothetical protein
VRSSSAALPGAGTADAGMVLSLRHGLMTVDYNWILFVNW